jgi:hypothetical protein
LSLKGFPLVEAIGEVDPPNCQKCQSPEGKEAWMFQGVLFATAFSPFFDANEHRLPKFMEVVRAGV